MSYCFWVKINEKLWRIGRLSKFYISKRWVGTLSKSHKVKRQKVVRSKNLVSLVNSSTTIKEYPWSRRYAYITLRGLPKCNQDYFMYSYKLIDVNSSLPKFNQDYFIHSYKLIDVNSSLSIRGWLPYTVNICFLLFGFIVGVVSSPYLPLTYIFDDLEENVVYKWVNWPLWLKWLIGSLIGYSLIFLLMFFFGWHILPSPLTESENYLTTLEEESLGKVIRESMKRRYPHLFR
jgi:hypothetical protein